MAGTRTHWKYSLQKGGDINARANTGYTPLHLAASAGSIECVQVLLRYNADIAAKDDYGKTSRQTAALSSKKEIVRLLISEGEKNPHKNYFSI